MRHWIHPFAVALLAAIVWMLPELALAGSWRPRLGVEAGALLGRMNAEDLIETEDHWSWGGSAGLIGLWTPAAGWALETGTAWERTVARETGVIEVEVTGGTSRISYGGRVRFDRIAFPLRLAFQPARASWRLEGGLTGAWLARARRDTDMTVAPGVTDPIPVAHSRSRAQGDAQIFEDVGTFDESDWTRHFHRWDLAALAGLGWDHPYGPHVVRARLRWQEGLTDMAKFDRAWRMRSVAASVGILF